MHISQRRLELSVDPSEVVPLVEAHLTAAADLSAAGDLSDRSAETVSLWGDKIWAEVLNGGEGKYLGTVTIQFLNKEESGLQFQDTAKRVRTLDVAAPTRWPFIGLKAQLQNVTGGTTKSNRDCIH